MRFCSPYPPAMRASIFCPATLFLLLVLLAGIQYHILLRSLQLSSIADFTRLQIIFLVLGTFSGIWLCIQMERLEEINSESSFIQALFHLSNTPT